MVGVLATGARTELRFECVARDGRAFVQLTHRRRLAGGGWEAWQELLVPVEHAGPVMVWIDRAAAQAETLPGVTYRLADDLAAQRRGAVSEGT